MTAANAMPAAPAPPELDAPRVFHSDRPRRQLGPGGKVASPRALEDALEEISFISSRRKYLQAVEQAYIDQVRAHLDSQREIVVGSQQFTLDEREEQLVAACEEYCSEHRDELCPVKKSCEFTAGTIGWRSRPASVAYLDGFDDRKCVAKIDGKRKFLDKLFELITRCGVGALFKVTVTVNKRGVLEAFKNRLLSKRDLTSYGLEVVEPGERFYVEPSAYVVDE